MPTISGLRRRGYTPESLREFAKRIGVAKFNSTVEVGVLENTIRDDLNKRAPRVMGVLRPIKLVIDNYPDGQVEELDAINNPEDPSAGTRKVPFSKVLYIERDDFREVPPPKYFRLFPGQEVRLRYAYFVRCTHVVKDPASGEVTEVHCTYDPATRGGDSPDGRKVKGTIHWVSAGQAVECEVRLYEHLFTRSDPESADAPPEVVTVDAAVEGDSTASADAARPEWLKNLNPNSLEIIPDARLEPSVRGVSAGMRYQFERHGYFCADADSTPARPVFNRTVTLKDTWAKIEKKQ
jgi:glutaminyl-tRNA synthetase